MDDGPEQAKIKAYGGPAGGWGSVRSLAKVLPREKVDAGTFKDLYRQNKTDQKGFMCVSCAWSKPAQPHTFEFCENGAKATAWEQTTYRTTPDYFAGTTVAHLRTHSDYELEQHGRLTHPLRYDPASDTYREVAWKDAFEEIGRELNRVRHEGDPADAVFYSSGRASLETSYMFQLFARLYGNNNLPDSSNMCHETTSVALKEQIGAPVGTTKLEDFDHCDAIFFFGQNTGSNSPRMLHQLRDAVKRGTKIVTFNPLKERGLERFTDPQNPIEMATLKETQISCQYHQVKAGGDIAALTGICKAVIAAEDARGGVLDWAFIREHTHNFDAFVSLMRSTPWSEIEENSGLHRKDLEEAAEVYINAKAVMGIYGMGLTQHRHGNYNVFMLVNLLFLRANIGRPGAGICPVRGHSNVQGQRTVGIAEKPELVPMDKLKHQFGFDPPMKKGYNTVEACEQILKGKIKAFVQLGGNFLRAVPDTEQMEKAWRQMRLTVHIATKLNRSHLFPGEVSFVLPCLGRSERDVQKTGPQAVTMEDSTSCIHGSLGTRDPASPHLLSEPAIVAGIAKATLEPNPLVPWDAWVGDYSLVRDAIAETFPWYFKDFNKRMWEPGGFYKGNSARERKWATLSGKAEFKVPPSLSATGFPDLPGVWRLITLRSNDQFNTTVYGYDDRFRGIKGTRSVLLMNEGDQKKAGVKDGDIVGLAGAAEDGISRTISNLRVTTYDIPNGCVGGYYPELNVLIPVWHHEEGSKTPAAKSVPVRIVKG